MDIQVLTDFFKWCTIINGGIFLLWAAFLIIVPDFTYRLQNRVFPIPREHSCLTNLAKKGMSPHALQQFAGHSSIETTNAIYVHIRSDFVGVRCGGSGMLGEVRLYSRIRMPTILMLTHSVKLA